MNTNRQNIQSPDHQAGRASSRLIFLLAFILAGLTLIAGSPSTGNKVQGATKNITKCGFGGSELIYDNEKKTRRLPEEVWFLGALHKMQNGRYRVRL